MPRPIVFSELIDQHGSTGFGKAYCSKPSSSAYPLGASYDGAGTNFALRVKLGFGCPWLTGSFGMAICPVSDLVSTTGTGFSAHTIRRPGNGGVHHR